MVIKHYLLSRFNLSHPQCDRWFEGRVRLFERYTLPSVRAQTNQDFTWFMLFDNKSEAGVRVCVETWHRDYPNFVPVWVEGRNTWVKERGITGVGDSAALNVDDIKEAISGLLGDATHVLTTRCDNDDLLHNTYMASVREQAEASDGKRHIICYPRGRIIWIDGPEPQGIDIRLETNMYLSLIESAVGFVTVNERKHHEWRFGERIFMVPIVNINAGPMWCWVRHDLTQSTTAVERGPVVNEAIFLDGFR